MRDLWRDVRYAIRMLLKNRAFTAVAIVALALGIGANTAIFSVINALVLHPLPFRDLDRLVKVYASRPAQGQGKDEVAPADLLDWRNQNSVFEGLAAYRWRDVSITEAGDPERVQGLSVSADFFQVLGIKATLGRTFLPEEEQPGHEQVVVISHGLWLRRFGGDPKLLGRPLRLDGRKYSVVGIIPQDFVFPPDAELWMPLALTAQELNQREVGNLDVVARLRHEVSLSQARSEMSASASRLERQYPQTNRGRGVNLVPLIRDVASEYTTAFLLALLGAVGFVLLIACANVANLQLARATGRQKEFVICAALGASRWRIMRQLLAESLLLALLGACLGLVVGLWGIAYIKASIPPEITRFIAGWNNIEIDGWTFGFTLLIALLTGIVSGLAPAFLTSKLNLNESLKEGGRGSVGGQSRHRLRNLLVVVEVALALVLLVGSGLMVKGFNRLLAGMTEGFAAAHVLTLRITLPHGRYPERHQVGAFYEQVLRRLASLPQAQSVGAVSRLPGRGWDQENFQIEGRPAPAPGETPSANFQVASPNFFQTLHIPLLKGRSFSAQDGAQAPAVAVISESMARRFWPDEDPLGQRIKIGRAELNAPWATIVGVVGDVKAFMFDTAPRPTMYLSSVQSPRPSLSLLLRTSGEPTNTARAVRAQVRSVDPGQPVYEVMTMERAIANEICGVRLAADLMVAFGTLALILSAVGVYGVISYSVSRRTHEIGIRVALGAQSGDLLRMVVGQGLKLAATGLAVGLPVALALTRLMSGFLFGVIALDLFTFVSFALLLTLVAVVACYVPARRATKVDPLVALRHE